MKLIISSLILLIGTQAVASPDNSILSCVGRTHDGDNVELSICVNGSLTEIVECDNNEFRYVKIRKENWKNIEKQTPPVIEQVEIPFHHFSFNNDVEEGFTLKLDEHHKGQVEVISEGDAPATMTINYSSIKHTFNNAHCIFSPVINN